MSPLLFTVTSILVVMTTVAAAGRQCTKFETFNLGLINIIGDITSRRTSIANALKSTTSDFVCLQEVWMEKDMSYLLDQVKSVFPHHYSPIHAHKDVLREPVPASGSTSNKKLETIRETACNASDMALLNNKVFTCGHLNNCSSLLGFEFGDCVAKSCGDFLKEISTDCVSCFYMNSFGSIADAVQVCGVAVKEHNRMNSPGLLVLSKQNIMESVAYLSYFPCHSQVLHRGYIQVNLKNGMTVVCTHLSSNISGYFEHDLDFKNYFEQQTEEVITLGRTFSGKDIVMLGDLNLGPKVSQCDSNPERELDGELEENYQLLLGYDYKSPYVSEDGRCTYCKDNTFVQHYPNQILDHVMLKGQSFVAQSVARLYDERPEISDHYGVQADVCEADKH